MKEQVQKAKAKGIKNGKRSKKRKLIKEEKERK